MQRTALEEGIELDLLETTRSPETLLVPGGHVDRSLFALRFGFRAFEDDDVAWHDVELR